MEIESFDNCFISNEMRGKIFKGAGINYEKMKVIKEDLRDWIKHQNHFPEVSNGDKLLESFILGCKGNVDKAKGKLDAYFSCRARYPEIFTNRDPTSEAFVKYAKALPFVTLHGRTEEGYRLHISSIEGDYDVTQWMKRVVSQWEVLLRTDPLSCGEIFLISGSNFTFSHATRLTPHDIATIFSLAQNVYPLRIRGIWFINAPPACDFIVNKLLKPVISKKLSERIQVNSGDHSILLDNFSSKHLPEDYGGQSLKLSQLNDEWLETLTKNRDWFITEGEKTTNEALRPSATIDSFGSISGSFRKLQID